MPNLTEIAGDKTPIPGDAMNRVHREWEESMMGRLKDLKEQVSQSRPAEIAARSGVNLAGREFLFFYWRRPVRLTWPELLAHYLDTGEECQLFDLALFLFYLKLADGTNLADRWLNYRQLPGGALYSAAFQSYSGDRLARVFGENPAAFHTAAVKVGGWQPLTLPRQAYAFQVLPRLRLAALLWMQDEEFPSRASILFDAHCSHYMTTDGLAILGSGLVSRLIKEK